MKIYETSAVVEEQGKLLVNGVPFQAGTRVEVTVVESSAEIGGGNQDQHMTARLMAALDKGANVQPVGPLRRDELYDRDILR